MSRMKNEYELHLMSKTGGIDRIPELADVDCEILPRIMEICGESIPSVSVHKPSFGLFYLAPVSPLAMAWNLFFMVCFYILQLQVSFVIAFGPQWTTSEFEVEVCLVGYILLLLMLLMDIFLNFHKGYYSYGEAMTISDSDKIISHYLKSWFMPDTITLLLFLLPLIGSEYYVNLLQLIPGILLWFKKFHYQEEIVNALKYRKTLRIAFILFVLFIDVLMIGNYGACFFIGIDLLLWRYQFYGPNGTYYWLINDTSYAVNLMDGPWYLQYVFAQSFSTGTLSSLAPGPFGKNPVEDLYMTILMTFFMILASYVGQVLVSILYVDVQRRVFHETNIQSFEKFMELKNVAQHIKDRVHNFFELIWEIEVKMETQEQEEAIAMLPKSLKEELLMEMSFIRSFKLIEYLPKQKELERLLAMKIERVVVDVNTSIFRQETTPRVKELYYVREGMAKFYIKTSLGHSAAKDKQIIAFSNSEKLLGSYEFLTGENYLYSCEAIDLCTLDKLKLTDFLEVIELMNLTEKIHAIRYQVLIQRNLSLINKRCLICEEGHLQKSCPSLLISMKIRQQMSDNDRMFSIDQMRKPIKRKQFRHSKLDSLRMPPQKKNSSNNIFQFLKGMNLEKMIMSVTKAEDLEQAAKFKAYMPEYNIF